MRGTSPALGTRHAAGHGGRLVALADQPQDAVAAKRVGVVLDPYRCCIRGSKGVDAEQVGKGPGWTVRAFRRLGEANQLEAIKTLGAGLVVVNLRQPTQMAGSAVMRPSMWAKRKKPRTECMAVSNVELDVRALDIEEWGTRRWGALQLRADHRTRKAH